MPRTDLVLLIIVALAIIAASVTDIWKFKVYNALTFPLLFLGLLVSTYLGGWQGLESSVLGAGLGFLFLFFLFALGGVGAGDVKLLTAVGAWIGPYLTYQLFVNSGLCAAIYAMILVLRRGGINAVMVELLSLRSILTDPSSWKRPPSTMAEEVKRSDRRRRLVPYAAMICIGYLATIAWWHDDLEEVWPPYPRGSTLASAPLLETKDEVIR